MITQNWTSEVGECGRWEGAIQAIQRVSEFNIWYLPFTLQFPSLFSNSESWSDLASEEPVGTQNGFYYVQAIYIH